MGIREGVIPLSQSRRAFGRVSLIDCIVAEIKGQILSGALKDGDMLASQDELARSLGVSRASLREAINRLNVMGLIEVKHGSGTFVRNAKSTDFPNSLLPLRIMDRYSADELLVAQYHIESAAACLAAVNPTEREIHNLRSLLDRMRSDVVSEDIDEIITQDLSFHTLIAETSKNQLFIAILSIISDLSRQFIQNYFTEYRRTFNETLEYHDAIHQAIRRNDSITAREKMQEHISHLARVAFGLVEWKPGKPHRRFESSLQFQLIR